MATNVISSTHVIIPANTSLYGNFPVSGGNLLSAGFQNGGFQTKVFSTQLMITNSSNVFFQINNQSSAPVTIVIWGVTDNPDAKFGAITDEGTVKL